MGPITGIAEIEKAAQAAAQGGASAVILHKGSAGRCAANLPPQISLIVHLSGSTHCGVDPQRKILVCSVEEAVSLGADAVSVHVNIGGAHEADMLSDFAYISAEARRWGMPLLVMLYPESSLSGAVDRAQLIAHAARLGAELGADLVKIPYTGDPESFRQVTRGCGVPVVVAGGPKMGSSGAVLDMVAEAMAAGAAGTALGRNVFQHAQPERMVAAIAMLVHQNRSVEEALRRLETPLELTPKRGRIP